jgi:hypothetical protein
MIKSLVEKNEYKFQRFFEISLGLSTWILLTSPIWLGFIYPTAVVFLLTFMTVYWSYLAGHHTYGLWRGYKKYKEELAVDWYQKCKELDFTTLPDKPTLPPNLESVYHLIQIPLVNEPEAVVRGTIDALFAQELPASQLVVAFALEEKYAEEVKARIYDILGERIHELRGLYINVHPAGIPGEARGVAAANRTWGGKRAVQQLRDNGENIRNYIFDSIDGDHVLHPQYLARVTHLYLTADRRDHHYYSSAVPMFSNNMWRVPLMMRIEAAAVTMGVLSDWMITNRRLKDSFSACSTSLQSLIDGDYWDPALGVDDTILYWRIFFARDGDFDGLPHFIPYAADAVEGRGYWESHRSLYKQLFRWGWGAIDFPLSMKGFLKNRDISMNRKVGWFIKHIQKRVILTNIAFLITFGFGIVTLVNPLVRQSNFAYSLPNVMSAILTVTLIFMLPATYVRLKLYAPMPKDMSFWKKVVIFLEGPLVILNMLTFSFVPTIHAQTRLLFGKKVEDLYFTPKVR